MLVETFPAAQLRAWSLPHTGYVDDQARPLRARIVRHLEETRHILIDTSSRKEMLRSADALLRIAVPAQGRDVHRLRHEGGQAGVLALGEGGLDAAAGVVEHAHLRRVQPTLTRALGWTARVITNDRSSMTAEIEISRDRSSFRLSRAEGGEEWRGSCNAAGS